MMDWFESVIFWPLNAATGKPAMIRAVAMIVFIPWFFSLVLPLGLPILLVVTTRDVWRSLK